MGGGVDIKFSCQRLKLIVPAIMVIYNVIVTVTVWGNSLSYLVIGHSLFWYNHTTVFVDDKLGGVLSSCCLKVLCESIIQYWNRVSIQRE